MQVSVESTGTLGRKITVQVPADRIDEAVDKKLKDLSHTVKLDGFRPGKVPMRVIKQKFSGAVRKEVMGDVLQSTLYEAITQENLRPAEGPKVEDIKSEPGQPMEYSASFEVYPEIELSSIEGKQIEKPVAEVTDADVENMLEKLSKQRRTWNDVEREAQEGDQLIIDFEGRIDGEKFQGGQAADMPLELGSNSMIPGFEEQLTGVKTGDKKTIQVKFPDDYHGEEVAGKEAEFDITVKAVKEANLPELDDEFAKDFGVTDGIDAFRKEVRGNMERELADRLQTQTKNAVMDVLLDSNELEVPQSLIDQEIENMMKQAAGNQPEAMKGMNLPRELFEENATKRVKLGLLVGELIQANNLEVDKQKVREKLEQIAATYDQPEQVIQAYAQNQNLMQSLEGLVIEDQVVDYLLDQVEINEKSVSFDDVMNEATSQ